MNLRMIAERAGVSAATVSNVINGHYNKVSEETRRRVEEIIRQTDYQPAAATRKKAGIRTIGMVLPFVSREPDFLINHQGSYALAQMENLAAERHARVLIFSGRSLPEVLSLIPDNVLDGLVVVGAFEADALSFRRALCIPVVFVDIVTDDQECVTVNIDDYRGGFLMARYLFSKGHRKIAVASPDYSQGVIHERIRGFTDACAESGIAFDESDIYQTDTIYSSSVKVGQDIALSDKGYTAIASMSDDTAFWMSSGIRQCGLDIPGDISIIGFDGIPEGMCFLPRLTSIEQDISLKIDIAGRYLFRMMDGEDIQAHDVLPVQVREGDSVKNLL